MRFDSPYFLLLAFVFPLIWFLSRRGFLQPASIRYASLSLIQGLVGPKEPIRQAIRLFIVLMTLALMIFALMRPQWRVVRDDFETQGIDILLALDVSGSMHALDFEPKSRLDVVKEVVGNFIKSRKHDRLGIITFSGTTQVRSPLTIDHQALLAVNQSIDFNENPRTAIGLAIASAINRLKNSPTKTKIIILLTDGENTAGNIDPITASKLAVELGIRIYTIGVGKKGPVPFPVQGLFGRYAYEEIPIDEETLQTIATNTGGLFFRATDPKALSAIYEEIGKLETSKIRTTIYYDHRDAFPIILWMLLAAMIAEVLVCRLIWRRFP